MGTEVPRAAVDMPKRRLGEDVARTGAARTTARAGGTATSPTATARTMRAIRLTGERRVERGDKGSLQARGIWADLHSPNCGRRSRGRGGHPTNSTQSRCKAELAAAGM